MRTSILSTLIVLSVLSFSNLGCDAQTNENNNLSVSESAQTIEVYYFHYSRRCATCVAVEQVTEKLLKELYPAEVESGAIVFLSLNLEEKDIEEMADDLGVSGQTLLVVNGDKKVNLTNLAFMNARTKPEKLKKALREAIEG